MVCTWVFVRGFVSVMLRFFRGFLGFPVAHDLLSVIRANAGLPNICGSLGWLLLARLLRSTAASTAVKKSYTFITVHISVLTLIGGRVTSRPGPAGASGSTGST